MILTGKQAVLAVVLKPVEPDDPDWKNVREYTTREETEREHDEVLAKAERAIAKNKDPFEIFRDLHSDR